MPAAKKSKGNRQVLAGSDRPRPRTHKLVKAVDAGEQVTAILVIRRKPGGPPLPDMNYWQTTPLRERRILTPVEYRELYGARPGDMSKAEAFFAGRGFVVLDSHAGRRWRRDFPQNGRRKIPQSGGLAISRGRDRLLRFLTAGRDASGSVEWDWRRRSA